MAGTILAAAGLARPGWAARGPAFAFSFDDMLPAVGQGSLAVETRADDAAVRELVAPLLHLPTAARGTRGARA